MNSPNISSNIARQILLEAKQNGVTVEEYLAEIAEENQQNGNLTLPKVRRTKTKVDLSKEREWLRVCLNFQEANCLSIMRIIAS